MAAHQAPPSLGFSRQEHWSGLHSHLQCMKVKSESEVGQSCPTLSDPMDCSLPGSSIHGIFQARVLEWGAIAFSVEIIKEMQMKHQWSTFVPSLVNSLVKLLINTLTNLWWDGTRGHCLGLYKLSSSFAHSETVLRTITMYVIFDPIVTYLGIYHKKIIENNWKIIKFLKLFIAEMAVIVMLETNEWSRE